MHRHYYGHYGLSVDEVTFSVKSFPWRDLHVGKPSVMSSLVCNVVSNDRCSVQCSVQCNIQLSVQYPA